jgi:hypothetical protein
MKKYMFRIAIFFGLGLFLFIAVSFLQQEKSTASPEDYCPNNACIGYEDYLLKYLRDPERKNPEFRIVQARNDQPTVAARHRQYGRACGFFSIAPIIEYLGYAHWEQYAHFFSGFNYQIDNGDQFFEPLDVGYYGSAEHLMASYINSHTEAFGQKYYYNLKQDEDEFLNAVGDDLNRIKRDCACYDIDCNFPFFFDQQAYGLCNPITNQFDEWMHYVVFGCGSKVHPGCGCAPTASCGALWFLNQRLHTYSMSYPMAGCNDAHGMGPNNQSEIDDLRRIIKAFIDHNLPLLISVRAGGHWMTLIGYTDLDSDGLPRTAISVDPNFGGKQPDYYIMQNIQDFSQWKLEGRKDSLNSIAPWNQHLDEACEPGGWATKLDTALDNSRFHLCSMPTNWTPICQPRFYGVKIMCLDNGKIKKEWFRYKESPFVAEDENVNCDQVIVKYADGENLVKSAVIERFWYDNIVEQQGTERGLWKRISHYENAYPIQDWDYDRGESFSVLIWDESWGEDYWIVADNLPGQYSKRRTTIELTLINNEKVTVEIAPPQTYGIEVSCYDQGPMLANYKPRFSWLVKSYFAEADTEMFDNTNFFIDEFDRDCDFVIAEVRLGEGKEAIDAEIQRWGYGDWSGGTPYWKQLTNTWAPDVRYMIPSGLSGAPSRFSWYQAWPNNYWLTADNVGANGNEDRKTVIILYMADGSQRTIEIVPR